VPEVLQTATTPKSSVGGVNRPGKRPNAIAPIC
jgi:hypothetical protein